MSKKPVQDSSNPFLSIDKSRFAKKTGDREQRGQTYIRNKSLNKLAKKAQAEAGSGADEKAGDYFTSLMSMGGVAKMKDSPKVNKSASNNAESIKEPSDLLFGEWENSNEESNAYPDEDVNELSSVAMEQIFAEPQLDLSLENKSAQRSAQARISASTVEVASEKLKPAQSNQAAGAGTMSAMLSGVKLKDEPKLEHEDKNSDNNLEKKQEEKLLNEYLASANKELAGQKAINSKSQNSSQKLSSSAFTGLAEFDPENEEHFFCQAMQQVAPLGGKGREVVPEPERPSGQIIPNNPLQDFLDGKVEFALEFTEEYIEGHVLGLDPAVIGKMRAGAFSYEAHLDLHGLNTLQAFDALVHFIRASYQRGRRSVLLIPGRGKNSPDGSGILRDKMQEWLTQDPLKRVVLAFCTALPKHGGPGALYVFLRKLKKSRGKIMWDRRPSDPDLFV